MQTSHWPLRIRRLNDKPFNTKGQFVLYWMTAFRRLSDNFALEHAISLANAHQKPLVILEALRLDYPFASARLHAFVVEGMSNNAQVARAAGAQYFPFVERRVGSGKGLLAQLSKNAVAVVGDDFPSFFLPSMLAKAADVLNVSFVVVDSNGLLPLQITDRTFPTAYAFRNFLQKNAEDAFANFPKVKPLDSLDVATEVDLDACQKKFAPVSKSELSKPREFVSQLKFENEVEPAPNFVGGSQEATKLLKTFLSKKLDNYIESRSEPEVDATTKLSPYLHFGHVSVHTIVRSLAQHVKWKRSGIGKPNGGKREGFWKMSPNADAFLDELVTWRELAYNFTSKIENYREYESLPAWAQKTMNDHINDKRAYIYSEKEFERAMTHDALWNAAMNQMKREGWFHNYMRMLWGKKILEWSETPKAALRIMESLMNKYSLDGRNPCSYSGYGWVMGRFDRPWFPERKVFGTIRFMSSDNTARKFSVKNYVEEFSGQPRQQSLL